MNMKHFTILEGKAAINYNKDSIPIQNSKLQNILSMNTIPQMENYTPGLITNSQMQVH